MRVPWEYENPICAEIGVEFFYPETNQIGKLHIKKLANFCKLCSHLTECAEWGIYKEEFGVWGGLSANQRKVIRRAKGIVLPREGNVA